MVYGKVAKNQRQSRKLENPPHCHVPLMDQFGKKYAREVIYYHNNPRKSASLPCPFNGMDIKAKRSDRKLR
jgi:hypothetical protein